MSHTESTTETRDQDHQEGGPAAAPTAEAEPAGLLARLREAGEAGRAQWEQLFAQVKALRDEQLPRLRQGAEESLTRLRRDGPFVRAQVRGTELLLQLLGRVRDGAESLEQSLRKAETDASGSDAPAAA